MAANEANDNANHIAFSVSPEAHDAKTTLSQSAFTQQAADKNDNLGSSTQRHLDVLGKGIENLPAGMWHALKDDAQHPLQTAEMLASSVAIGGALKMLLPEGGIAGKLMGLGVAGYFAYQNKDGFVTAWNDAGKATNQAQLDAAGHEMGDAAGSFTTNSILAGAAGKLGGKAAENIQARESFMGMNMDKFADAKANFWGTADNGIIKSFSLDKLGAKPYEAGQFTPKFSMNSDGTATLHDTARSAPPGEAKGEIDPKTPMKVSIYLNSQASELALDRRIARINSGKAGFITDDEMAKKFGPSQESKDQLTQWAKAKGLNVEKIDDRSGRAVIGGTVGDFQNAFKTNLSTYEHNGMQFRGRTGEALTVDSALAPHVRFVGGLDTRPVMVNRISSIRELSPDEIAQHITDTPNISRFVGDNRGPAPQPVDGNASATGPKPILASTLAKAYNYPAASDGSGVNVGIGELGGDFTVGSDKALYDKAGVKYPNIRKVALDGVTPEHDGPNGADGEVALDTNVIGLAAPGAGQTIVFGGNSEQGFVDTHTRMIFPEGDEPQNTAISWSWGMNEDDTSAQQIKQFGYANKQAVAKGIGVYVASGDDGATDRATDGKMHTDYPASDAWSTGVGGTQVTLDKSGKIIDEHEWNNGEQGGSGGGGRSDVIQRPPYQAGLKMQDNPNGGSFDGRGVPDVAANADPKSGYIVMVDGRAMAIGGTSGAAPMWAAGHARLSSAMGGKNIGDLHNFLYKYGTKVTNDITKGNNNGYDAGPGWDAVTGWGSPNGEAMLAALKADAQKAKTFKLSDIRPAPINVQENTKKNGG